MARIETIDELLNKMDKEISKRSRRRETLKNEYKNNKMILEEYREYKEKKEQINDKFKKEWYELLELLDKTCSRIRKKQPNLEKITAIDLDNIKFSGKPFPRKLIVGKIGVSYENLEIKVPQEMIFPVEQAIYVYDKIDTELVHILLLRLLLTLPMNKVQFTIYDPEILGGSIDNFRQLFKLENIFPQRKILTSLNELKTALSSALDYCAKVNQEIFDNVSNNWEDYNKMKYSQGTNKQSEMLVYKVFIFYNVPSGLDIESVEMIRKLIINGKRLGLLVLFSFDKDGVFKDTIDKDFDESTQQKFGNSDPVVEKLKPILKESFCYINDLIDKSNKLMSIKNLTLTACKEKFLSNQILEPLLDRFIEKIEETNKNNISLESLLNSKHLFDTSSIDCVSINIGFDVNDNKTVALELGDAPPHAFLGGSTGAGKSNFIHTFILSACYRFSPDELNVYILDFKDAVESIVYANYKLPHAKLVTVNGDGEFGVNVLIHLIGEMKRRNEIFKQTQTKDITSYRLKCPDEKMPRILVIIDEFQKLLDGPQKDKSIRYFGELVKQARSVGIHLFLSTQTLNGLDFGSLGTQFGGRIALRCNSADDSGKILGKLENDTASKITEKHGIGILNTNGGNIESNIKFANPFADDDKVKDYVSYLAAACEGKDYNVDIKIFDGCKMLLYPEYKVYENLNDTVLLGEMIDYDFTRLEVPLEIKRDRNILISSNEEKIAKALFTSIINSTKFSNNIENIFYFGNKNISEIGANDKVLVFKEIKSLVDEVKKLNSDKQNIIIFDNVNILSQIPNYPSYITGIDSIFDEFHKEFYTLITNANEKNAIIISFCENPNFISEIGMKMTNFYYRIGFGLSDNDMTTLIGPFYVAQRQELNENRACYVVNSKLNTWFRPYVGDDYE